MKDSILSEDWLGKVRNLFVKDKIKKIKSSFATEQEEDKVKTEEDGLGYQVFAVFAVSYPCISCGNFMGYTSSAVPSMQKDSETLPYLTSQHVSLIGGLGPLGALLGSLLTIITLRYFGTRRTIACFGVPALLSSWIILYLAYNTDLIILGRFIGGMGCGSVISSAPLYIVDICSDSQRGRLGIIPQFLMLFGILLSYISGTFLNWNNLALISAFFLIPSIPLLLFFCPDSPYWLLSRNYLNLDISDQKVLKILTKLKGITKAEEALNELKIKLEKQRQLQSITSSILTIRMLKPFLISIGLISLQQLSGINGVTFYALSILNPLADQVQLNPIGIIGNVSAIILAFTQIIASFSSSFFVERFGRKFLLILSSTAVALSGSCLGLYFYFKDQFSSSTWIPLGLLMFFAFGFAIGLGPVTWILIAELLPQETRQFLNPIVIGFNWLCTFAVTSSFPWLREWVNLFGIFWIYSGIAFIGVVFIRIFVPETKGKSQSEIQELF